MSIIAWIIFGGIAGWLASILMGSEGSHGFITNIILGIIGAVVGGTIMNYFGQAGVTGFNIYSLIVSVIGSIVLILVGRMISSI